MAANIGLPRDAAWSRAVLGRIAIGIGAVGDYHFTTTLRW
jgi:hypothetical protein